MAERERGRERGRLVGAIVVLAKSLCHSHGSVPPHQLFLAEDHPLHDGFAVSDAAGPPQTHCI